MNPGDLISGKYRLLRLLGSGGMGSVWAARNELTDRDFAMKFLLQRLASNNEALQRFFNEAKACGQLKHPAVVDVYDMGQTHDGTPYIVMEMLEGEGMDHRLQREGRFRPSEAAAWIAFVARGLDEAHNRGIVHRDLKPGNIFFALDDRGDVMPKVLDFGISKAIGPARSELVQTMQGTVLGSPAYMSPEQARGDLDVDARSDVWALGLILYEAITGKVPFDAANYNALMVAIMMQPHQPIIELVPTVPPELSLIIDRCLAKDRNERVGTARELADRLEGVLAKITSTPYPQLTPRFDRAGLHPAAAPSARGDHAGHLVGRAQGPHPRACAPLAARAHRGRARRAARRQRRRLREAAPPHGRGRWPLAHRAHVEHRAPHGAARADAPRRRGRAREGDAGRGHRVRARGSAQREAHQKEGHGGARCALRPTSPPPNTAAWKARGSSPPLRRGACWLVGRGALP
jgi:hypothetical protein